MSVACPKHKTPAAQSSFDYPKGSGNFGFYCTAQDPLGKKGRCNFQANADGTMRTSPVWGEREAPQQPRASTPAPDPADTKPYPIPATMPSRTALRMAALDFAGRVFQGGGSGELAINYTQRAYDFLLGSEGGDEPGE